MLYLNRAKAMLYDDENRRFDTAHRKWQTTRELTDGEVITVTQAVDWLQRKSGHRLRIPVGVIGPREATSDQLDVALNIGRGLARIGLAIICGGRQGVMEAVCQGAAEQDGLSIGLLPEVNSDHANSFVSVAVATGIGEARNALIARASFCLVAIGNSYGTLSEVALGLQFGKPVIGLAGAAEILGMHQCNSIIEALEAVGRLVLALPI